LAIKQGNMSMHQWTGMLQLKCNLYCSLWCHRCCCNIDLSL